MSDFAASQRMSPENIKGFSRDVPVALTHSEYYGLERILGRRPLKAGIGVPTRAISKKSNYYRKQISSLVGRNP